MKNNNLNYKCGYIGLIGSPNVGKSTLMNRIIKQKISITSKKAQTTRHRITGVYTDKDAQMIFIDSPGFQKININPINNKLNKNTIEMLNGYLDLVLLVTDLKPLKNDINKLLEIIRNKKIPCILVINKTDKYQPKSIIKDFIDKTYNEETFIDFIAVSAKHNLEINSLINIIKKYLPKGTAIYQDDFITDKSIIFLTKEIIREKLYRYLGQELPYTTNIEIETFTENNDLYTINANIIVTKESQKAIIIGRNGSKLKQISTKARIDIEELLEKKVFLNVWVKVNSNWAQSVEFLRDLDLM